MLYEDDELKLNSTSSKKKDKKKGKTGDLLFDLTSVSEEALQPHSSVINHVVAKQEEKERKKKLKESKIEESPAPTSTEDSDADTEWLDQIMSYGMSSKKKRRKYQAKDFMGFDIDEDGQVRKKKKKGKKKNKKGLTDYNKEFETEASMLRTLYVDQSKFTDSLQKKYDAMNNSKSSARGIGKFTTDLINSISTARSTQLSIVSKTMDLKKSIADLSFKEKKEFGDNSAGTTDNNMYASSFMKELLNTGRTNIAGIQDSGMNNDGNEVYDSDQLIGELNDAFGDQSNTDPDFIDFENMDVQTYVVVDDSGAYKFEARDKDGNVVPEYPLPNKSRMSFNRSTMMATDNYGRRYPLEISDSNIED